MYTIRGELDEAYVQKLAAYVDEKMHAIAPVRRRPWTRRKLRCWRRWRSPTNCIASQRDRGDREELLREQAERCLTLVERALKQTA